MSRFHFSRFACPHGLPARTLVIFQLLFVTIFFSSAIYAQSSPATASERVQELYLQAKTAEARGDFAGAAQIYESLLQISPRLAPAYNNLGSLYLRQREYKKAADVLEKGLKIDPKMVCASALLGIARYEMRDYAGARAPLETALRGNSNDDNAELLLANDLMKLDELNLAVEHLRKLAQHLLANAYWSLSMWDAANEQFRAELTNDPANCLAQWKIGNIILEQRGSPEEALSNVEKALNICPNLMVARVDRGRALMKLDRHAEAAKDLETAVKSDPAEPSTHFLLAQTYRALGRTQEAQAEMKLFSKLEESARAATAERAKQLLQERNKEQP